MKYGDFTELAENDAKYRPGYSPFVHNAIAGLVPKGAKAETVGAGTGT
jgi:hypothetical protein